MATAQKNTQPKPKGKRPTQSLTYVRKYNIINVYFIDDKGKLRRKTLNMRFGFSQRRTRTILNALNDLALTKFNMQPDTYRVTIK